MATTSISDLWQPDLWVAGTLEKENSFAHLFNSPAVRESARLTEFASGPGATISMPFLDSITDQADGIQVESTDIALQKHGSAISVAIACEREYGYQASALAAQRSGTDPVGSMLSTLAAARVKRRQAPMLAMARGCFDTALSANSNDNFVEVIGSQTADHLIDADMIIDASNLLEELAMNGSETVLWMHPVIAGALRKQDENSFKTTSTDGGLSITSYKGIQIYISKSLSRAGTTSGVVYDTYLMGNGVIGYGAKPQVGDSIDVASLQYDEKKSSNDSAVYDRCRYALHVDGMAYTGTPAGSSPTNAELQVGASWALRYNSADRVRMVRIRSNG